MSIADNLDFVTLPRLSIALGVSLDRLRRDFARNSGLRALLTRIGGANVVRAADVERIASLLRGGPGRAECLS